MSAEQDDALADRLAYGPRHPAEAALRRFVYRVLRVLTARRRPQPAASLTFYPPVRTRAELADLSARVRWYLPDLEVPVVVEGAAALGPVGPEDAPHMEPALVVDPGWRAAAPSGPTEHVLWRIAPRTGLGAVRRARHAELADPGLYFVSDRGYAYVGERYADRARATAAGMERLLARRRPGGSALVLATGPTAADVDPGAVETDVRITCNSAVADRELITALRPDVICFADPVFHFGPSRYAASFRRDLLRAVEETDALLACTDQWAHILLANEPQLAARMTILRGDPKGAWRVPSPQDPSVHMTGNILTALMLPIAFALADEVQIAGCDGRDPSEAYFWKHNQKTQYASDLMRSAFLAHPAFFRDRDYGDYYDQHCRELEELLRTAEAAGKTIRGVTRSHIPALLGRGAPGF